MNKLVLVEDSPSKRRQRKSLESPAKRQKSDPLSLTHSTPRRTLTAAFEASLLQDEVSSIASSVASTSKTNSRTSSQTSQYRSQKIISSSSLSSSSDDEGNIYNKNEIYADYDDYFEEIDKAKATKKIKKLFQPLREHSIYRQIFENPKCSKDLAVHLAKEAEEDSNAVILNLFEFIIDVCGYQKVEIRTMCDITKEGWLKEVLKFLESPQCDAEVYETRQYLFATPKTKFIDTLRMAIFNFLQKFIILAEDKRLLYMPSFAKPFFNIIKMMTESKLRNINHTSSLFGAKLLSTLCSIKAVIKERLTNVSSRSENEDLITDDKVIEAAMFNLYMIFVHHSQETSDKRNRFLLEDLIKESAFWIQSFPRMFISQLNIVAQVLRLVKHGSKEVRIEVLKFCHKLVETENYLEYFSADVKTRFCNAIEQRILLDVNEEVATLAAETLACFVKNQFGTLSDKSIIQISKLIGTDYKASEACASIWVAFLINNKYTNIQLLLEVVELSKKKQDRIPKIVECLLKEVKCLTHWPFIVQVIVSKELDVDRKAVLAKIACEIIRQVLKENNNKKVEDSVHVDVADSFFKLAKYALIKYKKVPALLIPIIESIMLVDPGVLPRNFAQDLEEIAQASCDLFQSTSNAELLEILGTFFLYLSERCQTFMPSEKGFVEGILYTNTKKLQDDNGAMNEEVFTIFIKLEILYSKFDLTNYLHWDEIAVNRELNSEQATKSVLVCQYWHLIWQLQNLVKKYSRPGGGKELQSSIKTTETFCKQFLDNCRKIMRDLKGEPLHFKVFDLVCKLHIEYNTRVQELITFYKQFEVLILNLKDDEMCNQLTNFIERHVVNDEKLSLYEKRCHIQQIINMTFLGCMPITRLGYIFKYYTSHKKEFGAQIEKTMSVLQTKGVASALPIVIVHTLTMGYLDILNKHKKVDIHSEEAKKLLALTKKFASFKTKLENLLVFAINWASHSKDRFGFLIFVRSFIDTASESDRSQALSLLELKFKDIVDVGVTYFVNALKKQGNENRASKSGTEHNEIAADPFEKPKPPPLPITITPQKRGRKDKRKEKNQENKTGTDTTEIENNLTNVQLV